MQFTITHTCGHTVSKPVLEATPHKCRKVVKVMETMKCIACIKQASK